MKGAPASVILVDAADFDVLQDRPWHCDKYGYVQSIKPAPRLKLHRVLLGLGDPKLHGDHRDGNKSDCRRDNLRPGTSRQNGKNRRKLRKTASEYKGVSLNGAAWCARIMADGRSIFLGNFADELSAAFAYDAAARKHHGEFARTNF